MTDRMKEYLTKMGDAFEFEKTEVDESEALFPQEENGEKKLKPGYTRTFDFIHYSGYHYYRHDLSDADEEFAKTVSTIGIYKLLKDHIANISTKLDKIYFWVHFWSIWAFIGIGFTIIYLLYLLIRLI